MFSKRVVSVLICALFLLCVPASVFAYAITEDLPMHAGELSQSVFNRNSIVQETYTHDSRFATGYQILDVIDISEHNGTVDWNKVYGAGVKNAILRGARRGYTEGAIVTDKNFAANATAAVNAGVAIGAYFYSQAITVAEAEEEANYLLNVIRGYNITLPVIFDFEYAESNGRYTGRLYDADLTKAEVTAICNAFCDKIYNAGYTAMVYANAYSLQDLMYADFLKYNVWLAAYRSSAGYSGNYVMWQYTSTGTCSGVSGNVDKSYWYVKNDTSSVIGTGNQTVTDVQSVLTVTPETATLAVGDTVQLRYVIGTDLLKGMFNSYTCDAVTFSSSSLDVATVDGNGNITCVATGTAVLTAGLTVYDNTSTPHYYTATCNLTVKEAEKKNESSGDLMALFTQIIEMLIQFFTTLMKLFA